MMGSGLSNRALAEIHTWARAGVSGEASTQLTRDTLQRFESGLRETPVIGLFDKLSLKNQLSALIDGFRRYHRTGDRVERVELERQFRSLFRSNGTLPGDCRVTCRFVVPDGQSADICGDHSHRRPCVLRDAG